MFFYKEIFYQHLRVANILADFANNFAVIVNAILRKGIELSLGEIMRFRARWHL